MCVLGKSTGSSYNTLGWVKVGERLRFLGEYLWSNDHSDIFASVITYLIGPLVLEYTDSKGTNDNISKL